MRACVVILVLLALAVPATADDAPPESGVSAWVSLDVGEGDRSSVYAGEAFVLELVVTYAPEFFEKRGVALFQQEMDVPLQVKAGWVDGLPGATVLEHASEDRARVSLVVDDEIVWMSRPGRITDPDKITTNVLSMRRRFTAPEQGEIVVPAPVVRFAHATTFRDDFLGGRTPVDRRDAEVVGEPLVIPVRPLPTEGRPESFVGAVGRFAVTASAEKTEVEVGESLRYTFEITGEGNLEVFDTPRVDFDGFHVFGAVDDRGRETRTVVYDIAAKSADVTEIPSIPFGQFTPDSPRGYGVVRTAPIRLTVRPAPGALGAEAPEPDPVEDEEAAGPWVAVIAIVGFFVAIVAVMILAQRRARSEPVDPRAVRRQAAAEALSHEVTADTFAEYLAAHLDLPAAAVIGPELEDRLRTAGLSHELAQRTAKAMDDLVAARYGGGASSIDATLVSELEAALAPPID